MGCKTNEFTDICGRVHCYNYTPPNPATVGTSLGVTIEYKEYPHSFIRDPDTIHSYNIPDRDNDAIMHPFYLTEYRSPHIPSATCGMATKTDPCSGGHSFGREEFDSTIINLDFTPSMLSFDFQYSDTWFSYIYDTSDDAGHIGIPAYWLEDDEGTVTDIVLPTGTPGQPGYNPGSETNTYSGTTACIPCTNFTCTPAKTTLKYEGCEDLTGDPDCPHPTLFAIDSESLKIAFSYDQFSTTVPSGVLDFELSFDGVTYADAWNATTLEGIDYNSSQNPWAYQDAGFSDFDIFDITDGVNASNFRVKFRIESRFDDSAAPPESNTVMLGTKWTCTEILNNGTGFTVGQVFPLSTQVGLSDGTLVNMTVNLKITAVGPTSGGNVRTTNWLAIGPEHLTEGAAGVRTQFLLDKGIYPVQPTNFEFYDPYLNTELTVRWTYVVPTGQTVASVTCQLECDGTATLKWLRPGETESTAVLSLSATSTNVSAQAIGQATSLGAGLHTLVCTIKNVGPHPIDDTWGNNPAGIGFTCTRDDTSEVIIDSRRDCTGGQLLDLLKKGDKINGHTITRTFHTEVGDFPYHIAYVDGSGSNFVKDTQFSSDRNHVITTKAGFGIPDRAIMLGLYEFLDKSLQYVTGDVNQKAPDIYNTVSPPVAWISINENGGISDINISSGVYEFNLLNFDDLNPTSQLTGYATDENIATTGGTGSGLTVDIEVGAILDDDSNFLVDRISTVKVNNPGTGYTEGDLITISGGAARVQVAEITNGGSNLDKLPSAAILEITSPADSGNAIPNKSTDDGEPEFILAMTPSNLKLEIVTKDGGADVEVISETGGNNLTAVVKGTFSGGSLSSIEVLRPGKGYTVAERPQLLITNVYEEEVEVVDNAAHRDDAIAEYQGIAKSLPEGDISASAEDLQAIDDSYSEVPSERENRYKNPPIEIKLDPQEKRIEQRSQRKLLKSQTDPLKTLIVPEYDLDFLADTPIDEETKQGVRDIKTTEQETVLKNIDDITQDRYPEYTTFSESKVQTNAGSFTNLPHASTYTKYLMRQYRPDPQKVQQLTVTLGCTPVNIGKSHFVCNQPTATPNTDTGVVNNGDGTTTQEVHVFSFGNLIRGPGCQAWEASGTMTIWHNLTRDARTVTRAAQAYGNPYDE